MSEISETEIKAMTKEQNYMRGYKDGQADALKNLSADIKLLKAYGLANTEAVLRVVDRYLSQG